MSAVPSRTAFAAGVVGRLGEALIEALVGDERYSSVYVATRAPLASTLGKLRPCPLTLQSSSAAIPSPIGDVFCCTNLRQGFYGRDRAYARVREDDVPAIARLARAAGARRFVLLTPLTPLDQLNTPGYGVRNTAELELIKAGFETIVLLRPSDTGQPATGNLFARMALGVGRVLSGYLIPQSMQPLRPHLVARAAVEALDCLEPGTHVLDAPAIRELLEREAGGEKRKNVER
jgi:hypothetical protein